MSKGGSRFLYLPAFRIEERGAGELAAEGSDSLEILAMLARRLN